MKSILLSIKPQYVAKILNGEKTIEIRRTMPKCSLPIDVYIYCTKGKTTFEKTLARYHDGKVVAKFTLNKVEEISYHAYLDMFETRSEKDLLTKSCLTYEEMAHYLKGKTGYAWHIDNLVIFDKPKDISEFWNNGKKVKGHNGTYQYSKLTRAPQSWQFIEV